jgi:hypothetical protein
MWNFVEKVRMLLWNRDLSGAKFGKAINKSLANIMKGTMLIDPPWLMYV